MAMRLLTSALSASFIIRSTYAQAATCYFANGTALPTTPDYASYQPCASGPVTTCCGTNRALPAGAIRNEGFTSDECLPNGLCQNRYSTPDNGAEQISFWVDFCTDQNVASKNCINVCPQRYPSGNVRLTPCNGKADSERWCCGEKTDCCSTSEVVLLAQVLGGKLSSGSASSASVATASGASTSISAPTSSSTSSRSAPGLDNTGKSSGISTGAIVGIIVGVLAAVALLATAIFLIRRARKTPAPYVAEAPDNPPQYQYQSVAVEKDAYAHRSELPQSPPVELSSEMPTELPAEEIHRGV